MNKNINILVTGLLSTGSSALIDILKEYSNISILHGEFNDYRAPGMVADQLIQEPNYTNNGINQVTNKKNKIRQIYSIFPILKPHQISLKNIPDSYKSSITRYKQLVLLEKLNEELISDNSNEYKIQVSNEWIQSIGKIGNANHKFVLFNQPLLPSNDIVIWKQVFAPLKIIVVFRDPKDQLAEIVKNSKLFEPFGNSNLTLGGVTLETIYGRDRKGAIKMHIDAIKKRFDWVDSLNKELSNDEFLLIDFEGLVNNYESYKNVIENFIGEIKPDPQCNKYYFDPDNARKNINIYTKYLTSDELKSINELEVWYNNTLKHVIL